ncbi:MAG TPA: hypothetical protein VLS49_07365 [Usitatibacter sp.]|nr:hypothetical protein [Usitatibacter sp.]
MKPLRLLAALALCATAACAHAVSRLADLRIEDRDTGRELPVYRHEGRAYVVGRPGHEYRIVVRNRAGEDLLAVVSVDGVNVLSGETASAEQGGYVLAPWRRVEIAGWRKSLDEVAAFYFTSLGDSYAGRTGRPANAGVIGVALFRRAAPPPPAPLQDIAPEAKEEMGANRQAKRAQSAPSAAGAPLGTGHGRREDSPLRYVEFERATSRPAETIALYYDSYANLVAQGVIPQPGPWRREPDPFPAGFVPDPS